MSQPPRYILNLLRTSGLFVLLAAKTNGNLASGAVATGPDAIDVSFNRPFSHVGKFSPPSIYIVNQGIHQTGTAKKDGKESYCMNNTYQIDRNPNKRSLESRIQSRPKVTGSDPSFKNQQRTKNNLTDLVWILRRSLLQTRPAPPRRQQRKRRRRGTTGRQLHLRLGRRHQPRRQGPSPDRRKRSSRGSISAPDDKKSRGKERQLCEGDGF